MADDTDNSPINDSTDYRSIFSALGLFPGAQSTPSDPSQQSIAPQQAQAQAQAQPQQTAPVAPLAQAMADQQPAAQQDANTPSAPPSSSDQGNAPYDVRTSIFNDLVSRGVGTKAAAGFVGGMMGESGVGLNPNAYRANDNGGPSGGIAQWHNDRFQGLQNFASQQGTTWRDPATQVGYLKQELDGPYSGVVDALKKSDSVSNGVAVNVSQFEKPADQPGQIAARTPIGNQLSSFVEANNGTLPAGQFSYNGKGGGATAPADASAFSGNAPTASNAPAAQAINAAAGQGNGFTASPSGGSGPLGGLMNGLGIGSLFGNPGFGQGGGGMADIGRRLGMMGMALAARDNPAAWGAYASLANNNTNQNDVSQTGYVKNANGTISPVFTDKMGNTRVGNAMPQGFSSPQLDANNIKQQQLDNATILLQARQAQMDMQQQKMQQGIDNLNSHDGMTPAAYARLQSGLITPQNNVTNAQQLIDQGDKVISDIDGGVLQPSILSNNLASLQNMAGDATPQSLAIKNLLSYKENAVNFYNQQNKGGGTVSRDQREANAFLPAGGEYDAAAIREGITRLNGRATSLMNNNINTLNSTYSTAPHLNLQMSGQPQGVNQQTYYNGLATKYTAADTARQAATDQFVQNYHKAPAAAAATQAAPAPQQYGGFLGGAAPAPAPAHQAPAQQAPQTPTFGSFNDAMKAGVTGPVIINGKKYNYQPPKQ